MDDHGHYWPLLDTAVSSNDVRYPALIYTHARLSVILERHGAPEAGSGRGILPRVLLSSFHRSFAVQNAFLRFRPHRMHELRTIATDDPVARCVCRSVCHAWRRLRSTNGCTDRGPV